MHTFVLQDWITIRGYSTTAGPPLPPGLSITQNAADWIDLSPFQDVFFWVTVSEVLGASTVSLFLETAPTADDALFQPLAGVGTASISGLVASATPVVLKYPMLSAPIPISRYLRWRLTNSVAATWDATFRIVVAANSPGM